MDKRFSVLMVVYKEDNSKFFKIALESVINQTILPEKIVLVQNGEVVVDIVKIIEEEQEKHPNLIGLVQLKRNIGLGGALSEGMKYINTPLVARADADDISIPNRFEKQIKEFDNNSRLIVNSTAVSEFNNNPNQIIGKRDLPKSDEEIRKFAIYRSPFNHPSVMFKREAVEKVGGYKKFEKLEDYHLWARLLMGKGECSNLGNTLVLMRTGNGMYDRRGGIKYLKNYYKLRHFFVEIGFISKSQELIGDFVMTISSLIPTKLRQFLYTKILHKA